MAGRPEDQGTELRQFYDQWAAKRAASTEEQEYVRLADEWKWANLLPLITRFIPNPRHILELGCGSGDMLVLAHQEFPTAQLYGIDLSERMLEMARERLPDGNFILGDAVAPTALPAVDLGLAVDILEHLPDPVSAARQLGAHSELVAFKIPLERQLIRFGLPKPVVRGADHPAGHLHFWTLSESRALLHEAGFELLAEAIADPPEAIRYHPGIMDTSTTVRTDALRHLRRLHHACDVALEKWSCKHFSTLHRAAYGSNHFAVGKLRG